MPVTRLDSIYEPEFVRELFDEMSKTYGIVNVVSSFGFCFRWRRQCVEQISIRPGDRVFDLMSGMGELNHLISRRCGQEGRISSVDISESMCRRAVGNSARLTLAVETIQADILQHDFEPNSADVVVSCFGLKTFSPQQQLQLAERVHRILRPGGKFAFLEISVPGSLLLKMPYMFYLNHVIPVVGRLFMGNADNYRLLGVYTREFGSCEAVVDRFRASGLEARSSRFFFGCASGIVGQKPE